MKKGLEKFLSIIALILGTILAIFLVLSVFGKLDDATLQNEVVRTMIVGLSILFLVVSVVMIVTSFNDHDVLKAVVLSSDRVSTTRVSLAVIRKIVAKNAKYISGLTVSGVALLLDENNAIRMKLTVKISENDVDFVVDRFRCLLFDAFYAVLGVEFVSIDFKVKALSPKYAPDMNKVDRAAAEIKEKREKLMLQKLKMEEEESKFETARKLESEKRHKEESRQRREREELRKRERIAHESIEDIIDGEEARSVSVVKDTFHLEKEQANTSTSEEQQEKEQTRTSTSEEPQAKEQASTSTSEEPQAKEQANTSTIEKEQVHSGANAQLDINKKELVDMLVEVPERVSEVESMPQTTSDENDNVVQPIPSEMVAQKDAQKDDAQQDGDGSAKQEVSEENSAKLEKLEKDTDSEEREIEFLPENGHE